MNSLLKTFALGCILTQSVSAEEWKSADGVISVTVPDQSRFLQAESTPPLSIIWVSTDERIKLSIAEVPFPLNMRLIQSSLEKGMTEEIGGKVLDSTTEQRKGHEVFIMTGQSDQFEPDIFMTQAIVAIKDKAYKVMAIGVGKDARTDPDAIMFLSSFKIHVMKQADPPNARSGSRGAKVDAETSLVDLISQKLGAIGFLLLMLCGIISLILRSSKRKQPSENGSS